MKNFELFLLAENLGQNLAKLQTLKGAKFCYNLAKNMDILEAELKVISTTSKPSDEFTEYDKKRVALCEEFAKKDAEGKPEKRDVGSGQFEFVIDTESQEWKNAIEKLREDNKTVIETRDAQIAKYNELLDLESTVEFRLTDLNDIDNDITLELMRLLKPFLKD